MPGASARLPLATLKKRSEFLRVRGGARHSAHSFLMEARRQEVAPGQVTDACEEIDDAQPGRTKTVRSGGARFGFTVTKKLGNAVVRNRIRRRLKEAIRQIPSEEAHAGCDYVLIARPGALTQQFQDLVADLRKALKRIDETISRGPPRANKRRGGRRTGG